MSVWRILLFPRQDPIRIKALTASFRLSSTTVATATQRMLEEGRMRSAGEKNHEVEKT